MSVMLLAKVQKGNIFPQDGVITGCYIVLM